MGSTVSCCCYPRTSRIGPSDTSENEGQNHSYSLDEKRSSSYLSGLAALIPGMNQKLDSSSLRRNVTNHLTISATQQSMEFVHGANELNTHISGVNENEFLFHHLIDTGGFGFVFKATRKATGITYALKVQPMEFMARLTRAGGNRRATEVSLQMEKTVLATCRGHPFIVSLEYSFHTSLYAVIALEYVPG